MICKRFDVTIRGDNKPVNVEVRGDGLQLLKLEGNVLSISNGNSVTLPASSTVDLTDVNNKINKLSNDVIMMRSMTWTENAIKNISTNQIVTALIPIRSDIRNLQTSISKVDDMEMQIEELKDEFPTYTAMNNHKNGDITIKVYTHKSLRDLRRAIEFLK